MTTAYEIIRKAMQKAGIIFKSEAPDADEINDGLYSLNSMLSSWSNESILIYVKALEQFTLSAGQVEYTIGPGQEFDTSRPLFIDDAHVRINSLDYDLTLIPDEIYQGYISLKSLQGIPQYINYSNGYPYAKIRLYPIPSNDWPIFILSEKQLDQFTLYEDISLPPGWERALIYNLAVEIMPEYGQQPDPLILKLANDTKAEIARSIMRNQTMDSLPSGDLTYPNIYNGYRW